jgi:hypothetical protein
LHERVSSPIAIDLPVNLPAEDIGAWLLISRVRATDDEDDPLNRRAGVAVFADGVDHRSRADLDVETSDAGAEGREGDARQAVFVGELERATGGGGDCFR